LPVKLVSLWLVTASQKVVHEVLSGIPVEYRWNMVVYGGILKLVVPLRNQTV